MTGALLALLFVGGAWGALYAVDRRRARRPQPEALIVWIVIESGKRHQAFEEWKVNQVRGTS